MAQHDKDYKFLHNHSRKDTKQIATTNCVWGGLVQSCHIISSKMSNFNKIIMTHKDTGKDGPYIRRRASMETVPE